MKISEVIAKLEELKRVEGDVPVLCTFDEGGSDTDIIEIYAGEHQRRITREDPTVHMDRTVFLYHRDTFYD